MLNLYAHHKSNGILFEFQSANSYYFFFLAKFPLKDNKYAKSPKKLQMVFHWCPISQYCFAGVHKMFVFVLILKFVSLVEKVKSE